ncbi:MAG: D-isomer specific 2-hydroxyacid dehydrogenase, NAD-binding protein [Parcubacteria group bacterium GW2011_GWB1_49_7]|uniref:D-glycerate dehydrogenase n=1 Tax=Candidatus Zambryskibacteria bacterium RIFCSPHIGHO2_01_FULL_46_25 TaxID=1802738 RepID=A0A1G2T161_9BACT|nr:MAG: D-isomer specific 2-hydroxyacid dehydrogenase, NAD-binding protein [Parcubacteria group bacterium GW2011_GWA1_47_10]KKW10007.1 MAG: D-isomer specific 2-hydroxyacid dehydrogenase, NAD-binding protein [Parcubacteria group bacterium GW2011_GWB1_49_7]OHA90361.1 MAG: hypothetical protein A2838_02045 [Candidatus Zambryskibacteria bacterium RIFCSPHIGHO2_01_FULL_46_25]OHB01485.1 MAG: hypothetical protein A3F53_02150 [Candidatus Zambryskibacteria bacterium RIFCSPHIGHO2_12_FULL_48_10]OHB06899.1 M
MTKVIFVTRKIPEIGIQKLRDKGYEVDVNESESIPTQDQLLGFLKTKPYDAVITLLTDKIDSKIFDATPSVKLYANYATGFDNIDVAEAGRRGIMVANAPAELTSEAVAEHTIALMLALAARIVESDEYVRKGLYQGWSPMNFIGTDVLGKTLGIVGAGRIGGRVGKYARGLGMKIVYTDVARNEKFEAECGAVYKSSLEEVLSEADIVSLHVPLFESTRHLMNKESFSKMKPTSFLINTSRGPVVEESALEEALKTGVIAGAALDVFEFEPKISDGLIKLQNIILTPHIASASIEARNQMAELAADNVIDFLEGATPRNLVNPMP